MRLVGFFLAIVLAAAAAFLAWKMGQKPEEAPATVEPEVIEKVVIKEKEVPQVEILVARQDIPLGVPITSQHIDQQPWPQHLVLDNFILSDGAGNTSVMNLVTRSTFQQGEPIIRSKLANPNEPSFMAAALPKGMRATTISVDALSAVAGFIYPGDRVDILITHTVPIGIETQFGDREEITEVLLSNVKILAVDQQASVVSETGPSVPGTVTVEVTPADAQRLRLAERDGQLSLVLRSLKDADTIDLASPTGISDLSRVTPPTYFPVLYDTRSTYDAEVVDMFNTELSQQELIRRIREKNNQRLDLGAVFSELGQDMPSAATGQTITIYRGVDREVVGVDGP